MEDIFWKLLEIKTGKKNLLIKAVYVPNATASPWEWAYYIYYYDIYTHSFFINDVDDLCNNYRTKALNIIENIVTKAFHQEMNSFVPLLQKLQMRKKPKVFLMYIQKKPREVVIDEVELKGKNRLGKSVVED